MLKLEETAVFERATCAKQARIRGGYSIGGETVRVSELWGWRKSAVLIVNPVTVQNCGIYSMTGSRGGGSARYARSPHVMCQAYYDSMLGNGFCRRFAEHYSVTLAG